MKLYTINATPIRNFKQLTPELQRDIRRKHDTLKDINSREVGFYPDTVADVLKGWGFDGFTIYPVQGYWQGVPEVSFKIEIALEKDFSKVYNVATELRDMFNQDSVMVTDSNNKVTFV